jgi:hypothetical protein
MISGTLQCACCQKQMAVKTSWMDEGYTLNPYSKHGLQVTRRRALPCQSTLAALLILNEQQAHAECCTSCREGSGDWVSGAAACMALQRGSQHVAGHALSAHPGDPNGPGRNVGNIAVDMHELTPLISFEFESVRTARGLPQDASDGPGLLIVWGCPSHEAARTVSCPIASRSPRNR